MKPRVLHVHSVPATAERLRTIVEIAAIIAAGLWALYTFVYEQRIKPLSEEPSFAVPTDIEQGPTIGGVALIRIHKRLINTGNVPVDVAAEAVSVFGETLERASRGPIERTRTSTFGEARYDVPRRVNKLFYTFAQLREGAIRGNRRTNFVVPPHSSNDEDFLIAVPAKQFPIIRVRRKDYVLKFPIDPKVDVWIVQTPKHAYDLDSKNLIGEYDSDSEYAIRR